ncbi:dicarboxylate/amino acid:cation symporter [Enterococcus timonensis]|uniref:dicarboxylate/amino acid:cation symporter n=1 Tax=Enterococcus timonensis TaxID=1852364 RepID=UPI0008D9BE97|nr:dicarboxylate/amino acid:cation symporter [Enterococcus timonensis]
MKKIVQYKDSLFLLAGLILGGGAGLIWGEKTAIVKPVGTIFLNLMYMILVPLVFFSISAAIGQMTSKTRLGKILAATFGTFLFTSLIAAVIGFLGVALVHPIDAADSGKILALMGSADTSEALPITERIVNLLTVDDFSKLLSKSNMLPLIIFSLLIGLATSAKGKSAKAFQQFLVAGNAVVMQVVTYVMYLAPIGLGCYFAVIIGELGAQIINGYFRVFVLYLVVTVIYFFGVLSFYAFLASGKVGLQRFWKNIPVPAATAMATCSSAASIPANLEYTQKIGVSRDIVDTVIPLGANVHKDGSVVGGIFKIAFLFLLFGRDITTPINILAIIFGGFFVGAIMGAIPGGGLVAETLIVSLFGFPTEAIPLVIIISTIIDIPATLLNSTSNIASAMLVHRLVDKKQKL